VGNFPDLIISFAGNLDLARDLFKHMSQSQVLSNDITKELAEDEIRVSLGGNTNFDNIDRVKRIIEEIIYDYLDSRNLTRHKVTKLENLITVGIPKDIDEISNLLMCEICGWRVTTEEELLTHRRTHGI
jgi:hypothetical protein